MAMTPRDPAALRVKIREALQSGNVTGALSLGKTLIKIPRASIEDCINVSRMCDQLFDTQGALIAMRRALRRDPGHALLGVQLAQLEYFSTQTENAIETLAKAKSNATSADNWDGIAQLLARMGLATESLECFATAAGLAPDRVDIKERHAMSLSYFGRVE